MKWLVAFLFFVAPVSAFAAVGFAQESVWLSHTPVILGETVSIYAALTNGSAETLTSVAYFRDNGKKIGSLNSFLGTPHCSNDIFWCTCIWINQHNFLHGRL
jgi:hypothetical protein